MVISKKLAAGVLLIICGVGLFLYFSSNSHKIKNYPSTGSTIIAFGDSLVQGVGSTEGNDFVTVLSQKINTPIINLGHSGDTTSDALLRINDVTAKDPKIVMVLLGGNDFLKRVPRSQTLQNLERIITTIQNTGAIVILLGVRGGLITDTYESDLQSLAERTGSAYVSNVLKGLIGNHAYMYDSVHPNNVGYARIAERIYPLIIKLNT